MSGRRFSPAPESLLWGRDDPNSKTTADRIRPRVGMIVVRIADGAFGSIERIDGAQIVVRRTDKVEAKSRLGATATSTADQWRVKDYTEKISLRSPRPELTLKPSGDTP